MTALELAKKAATGTVVCFEPSASNFERLKENIALIEFKNCKIQPGSGTVVGQFKLYNVVDSNFCMKSILKDADQQILN